MQPEIGKQSSLSDHHIEGIELAQKEIEQYSQKIKDGQGLSRIRFFLGIVNLILVSFIFGWAPEYYWLIFISKAIIVIPLRLYTGIAEKSNFYLADFCWISVLTSAISFACIFYNIFDEQQTRMIMRIIFVFGNGPQGWSAILFNNALVFHSFNHFCSVFVHLSPVLASFSMRWNFDIIQEKFPGVFPQEDMQQISNNYFSEMFLPSFKLYLIWWVLYTTWMCFHGLYLPKSSGQDTVFNWLYLRNPVMKNGIDNVGSIMGQKKNQQTKLKVVIYMFFHMFLVLLMMTWAYLCFFYKYLHFAFLFFILLQIAWKASGFYVYFTLHAPIKSLKKLKEKHVKPE